MSIKLIDLHCDTISKIYKTKDTIQLKKNDLCIDILKLKQANSLAQFFAIFVDTKNDNKDRLSNFEYAKDMIKLLKDQIENNSEDINIALNYGDIVNNKNKNKISAIITLEEGGIIDTDINRLQELYNLGVRLITLSWNYPNTISYPNYNYEYSERGLTNFGKQVVLEMNRLGMIIDVSHISDKSFIDILNICKAPFIASHSNSRTICNHPRNLTDSMIKSIANIGGVIGVNFYNKFLGNKDKSTILDMVKHINYIRKIAGIDVIGIGSDYDGFDGEVEIQKIRQIDKLIDELKGQQYSTEDIEKIFYKNALRVFKEVVG